MHSQSLEVQFANNTYHSREVHDVGHKVVAVGSRSFESAQKFIDENAPKTNAKAYGTYADVYADPVSHLLLDEPYIRRIPP